jgi:hypothetical protein
LLFKWGPKQGIEMQPSTINDAADILRRNHPRLNDRRLAILRCLRHRRASLTLAELAEELTSDRPGVTRTDLSDGRPARVGLTVPDDGDVGGDADGRLRVRLHHVDLPLLDDLGFLEYDAAGHLVSPPESDGERLFA